MYKILDFINDKLYKKIVKSRKTKMLFVMALIVCILSNMLLTTGVLKKYGGTVKVSAASSTLKTIYFDTHGIGSGWNGWTSTGDVYVYMFGDGVSGVTKKMSKSQRENTLFTSDGVLYEIQIDTSVYTSILFKNLEGWDTDTATQTVDISLLGYSDNNNMLFILNGYIDSGDDKGKKNVEYKGDLKPISRAGITINFYDMTGSVSQVMAVFNGEGLTEKKVSLNTSSVPYTVNIPDDVSELPYQTVKFVDADGNVLSDIYNFGGNATSDEVSVDIEEDTNDTFYYGAIETKDGTNVGKWSETRKNVVSTSLAGKILYFDNIFFNVQDSGKIIIDGNEIELTDDFVVGKTYAYTFPDDYDKTTTDTVITFVKSDGKKYRFFWNDTANNLVTINSDDFVVVSGVYNDNGGVTVYFNATLSKLSYANAITGTSRAGDYGIPSSIGTIRYYATGSGKSDIEGDMQKVSSITIDGHTYSDLYKVDLPQGYEQIVFSNFDMSSIDNLGGHGESTKILNIPDDLTNPCFYADSSDDYVYSSSNVQRDGYWAEIGTVRDPEKEDNDTIVNEVVDIPEETQVIDSDKLYVSSTFYDFYTDYELNGKNRDTYNYTDNGFSHRIYQPFRQFDQALSDYYSNSSTTSSLYWGNFQNYDGAKFSEIADTLDLYGYSNYNKFFYENNSMWDSNNKEIALNGENAVQGLVSDELKDGKLMMKTENGSTVEAPFFNEDFLSGNNSKNTVLGKVYNSVEFPFKKKALTSHIYTNTTGTVNYWYFDSKESDNNLRMYMDSDTGSYYLKSSNDVVKGTTTNGITALGNFFPFNSSSESGNVGKLNYGFGTKLELNFKLTKDGYVTNSDNNKVPIEFNFSGDDDIWIFIDGKLALDIGGDHGVVTGYLNFADLTYNVSAVKNSSGGGATSNVTGSFSIEGDKKDEHTLTLFYMERGLWESNMYMSFNFPDENYLEIEKQVDESDVNQELFANVFDGYEFEYDIKNLATHYGTKNATGSIEEFTGFIMKQYEIADYGSATSGKLEIPKNAIYTLEKSDGTTSEKLIDDTGTFTLSHGDSVLFYDQFRRGSYISVSEKENVLFDTTYTMYENDEPITSMNEGENVELESKNKSLVNVHSASVDDGRSEVYKEGSEDGQTVQNTGYTSTKKPDNSTIVFRSYKFPDSKTANTQLKIVYTNKVKTGSIKITKSNMYALDELNGDYTFTVTFSDVGGENLEKGTSISKTITLKNGESYTISGIPINTSYTITETSPDASYLKDVVENNSKNFTYDGNWTVEGKISDDKGTYDYNFTFKNTLKPVIDIDINKKWVDLSDNTLTENVPDSITVAVLRRWGTNDYEKVTGYENITLTKADGWTYKVEGLDKYVDYTLDSPVLWEYKVVETNSLGEIVEESGIIGDFKVSYEKTEKTEGGVTTGDLICVITNKYIPHTTIKIIKSDATDNSIKLSGVWFKIEKLNDDYTKDETFSEITNQTNVDGILVFKDLYQGIYRITEVKTQSDYSLLKEPIIVVINRLDGNSTINSESCIVENDTISVNVSNRKKFILPSTGGYGRTYMVIAGILLMCIAGFIYTKKQAQNKRAK